MNSMQLKDKLKNISKSKNINFNVLLRNYMYERFIERLVSSEYKNNFILKGGYYLSLYFGLDSRYTMDIDLSLKNLQLTKENILKIINEIIQIDINDNIEMIIDEISNIREEDEYGGYRIKIIAKLENIREIFNIDIATGDPITPKEIVFQYRDLLNYKFIDFMSYNLETVLAEKMESILSKEELSSRLKDYYDIYLILTLAKDKINVDVLRKAVDRTFAKRQFNKDMLETFEIIKKSEILKTRWNSYSKKYKYAANISYEDVIDSLNKIINIVQKEPV